MHIPNSVRIGESEIAISENVVRVNMRGDFVEQHARLYAEQVDAHIPRGVRYAAIADVSDLRHLGPAARRYFAFWHKEHNCERCAFIGAPLPIRIVLHFVVRAVSLVGPFQIECRFFAGQSAAEDWIAEWKRS